MERKLYTISEVAKILRVSNYALREKLIKTGKLKIIWVGSMKVTSTELDRFLKENEGTGERVM